MDVRISSKTSRFLVAIIATVLAMLSIPAAAAPGDGITEYPLLTALGSPVAIAAGPDGNMWFTESGSDLREELDPSETGAGGIGRITPTGIITEYPLLTAFTTLGGITAGPDGNMWFTETFHSGVMAVPPLGGAIGRITPTGTVTEYPLPTAGSSPQGIAAGPDGNLWYAASNSIGRITTDGVITEYPGQGAGGIAAGPDGNLWFTTSGTIIRRITLDGTITEYPLPTAGSSPLGITAGPDGNMWFTESSGNKIGRITPAGAITEYKLPTAYSDPYGIAAGPDGNMWFTERLASAIGRITPEGVITEYKLPYISYPGGIAAGPDGNLWFTDGGKIGRISPAATPLRRWTCPITVTLHKPAPRRVGTRILTDKITTNGFCVLPKPVVRCRPLANTTDGKKALCNTKVTKRGKIRVNTKGYEAVRVTVIARATPKNKPGFPGPWKRDTWRKSWLLR